MAQKSTQNFSNRLRNNFFLDLADIMVLSPLCREYQVEWLTERIKDYIKETNCYWKSTVFKCLKLSEEMNFGQSVNESLINELHENFPILQTSTRFMSLSSQMQILIARKRLWLLLRFMKEDNREVLLNEEGYGFLSIFEGQKVFNFKYNGMEKHYIEHTSKIAEKLKK